MSRRTDAFSLVELLVATAVVALMVVIVAAIAGSAVTVTSASKRRMSADSGSREALNRMAADLASPLLRNDLPDVVEKRTGNDRLSFHAQVDGYGGDRGISLVSYLVSDHPALTNAAEDFGEFVLLRGSAGTDWASGSNSLHFGTNNILPPVHQDTIETAASDVFRFEVAFLMADGSILAHPSEPLAAANGYLLSSNNRLPPAQRIAAIIVGVAALDADTRHRLGPDRMQELAELFPDAMTGTEDILTQWQNVLDDANLAEPKLQAVRVYQRYFHLRKTP